MPPSGGRHYGLRYRRWAAWGARRSPAWFIRIVAPFIGTCFALFVPKTRARVLANLRRIHGTRGELEELRDVLATFKNFAGALTESLAPQRGFYHPEEYRVRGAEKLDQFSQARKGMLFVTAHVGPWDAAATGLRGRIRVPLMMLMAAEGDADAGAFHDSLRSMSSVTVLRIGESELDVLPALAHLEAGGIVVAQFDRVLEGKRNVETQLFGQDFLVPEGLFRLAGLAKVPMVPVFSASLGFARRLIEVGQPIFVEKKAQRAQLQECASRLVVQLERHLAAFPTQWFHFVPPDSIEE